MALYSLLDALQDDGGFVQADGVNEFVGEQSVREAVRVVPVRLGEGVHRGEEFVFWVVFVAHVVVSFLVLRVVRRLRFLRL